MGLLTVLAALYLMRLPWPRSLAPQPEPPSVAGAVAD
jgi:hypothetical protein